METKKQPKKDTEAKERKYDQEYEDGYEDAQYQMYKLEQEARELRAKMRNHLYY